MTANTVFRHIDELLKGIPMEPPPRRGKKVEEKQIKLSTRGIEIPSELELKTELVTFTSGPPAAFIGFGNYSRMYELSSEKYKEEYQELCKKIEDGKYKLSLDKKGQVDLEIL